MNEYITKYGVWIIGLICLTCMIFGFKMITALPKFGVIDANKLINAKAQKLAVLYPKGNVQQEKLQQLIDSLRQKVQIYSEDNNLILLSKTFVLGGELPDYTETVLEIIKEDGE